jgi:hypothetical protein
MVGPWPLSPLALDPRVFGLTLLKLGLGLGSCKLELAGLELDSVSVPLSVLPRSRFAV